MFDVIINVNETRGILFPILDPSKLGYPYFFLSFQ